MSMYVFKKKVDVEANDAFMKMFCGDMYDIFASRKEGLSGASLDRIISFSDIFSQLLKSGGDIHKSHYQVKNKLYDISAFTIEDGEIVGAVITDVTKAEIDREKIEEFILYLDDIKGHTKQVNAVMNNYYNFVVFNRF